MEYIFPTYPQLTQLLTMDARISPLPDETASSPKSTDLALSQSPEARSETTMSSDGPSSPTAAKFQYQRRSSCKNTNSRDGSFSTEGYVSSPRSLEALYTEYGYLKTLFQKYAGSAATLVGQHVASMQSLGADKEPRRLRKRLGLLRSRIKQAVDQEKAVFNRLAELSVEIPTREMQALNHLQGQCSMDGSIQPIPSTYGVMSPECWGAPLPTTPLNASSPEFIPGTYFEDASRIFCRENFIHHETTLDTVVEEAELGLPGSPTQSIEEQVDNDVETDEAEDDWVDAHLKAARARRLSLPCLQTSWP